VFVTFAGFFRIININQLKFNIMGQYYKPVNLDTKEWLYSHKYNNGLKLMEHSWIGNNFVAAVVGLIVKGGAWYGNRIAWAGDYADNEPNTKLNLYSMSKDNKLIQPLPYEGNVRYLKNLDTKEFVDLKKVPAVETWQIHPLPLLTCEGNGRGGGDYNKNSDLVGKWARQRVVMQKSKPKNCQELIFDLIE
jgi:hypothetical protein